LRLMRVMLGTPASVDSDVVQFNTLLFGVCEDRAELGEEKSSINGYFWLDLVEATWAW